jgi:rhodanese-related sulfurtransferase
VNFLTDNILYIGVAVLSGGALLLPALLPGGKRASPAEVVQIMNRGKNVLVDIRTPEEFAAGHLRDAKNIPMADFDKRIGELEKSKSKSIVVICQTGAKADKAVRQLQAAGFQDVVALEGGLAAWQGASLPTVK